MKKKGWYEKKSQVRKKITGMLDPITGMKKNHRYEKKSQVCWTQSHVCFCPGALHKALQCAYSIPYFLI